MTLAPVDGDSDVIGAACRLMPQWQRRDLQVIGFLSGGYSNRNYRLRYRGEDFALRLPTGGRAQQLRFEHAWWQRLPEAVSVPLIRMDAQSGALLTRWQPGPLLAHVDVSDAALLAYLRELHDQLPDPGRHYDVQALVERWLAPGDRGSTVRSALSSLSALTSTLPCHNDLNPWNVICGERRWVTLDWEFVGCNDPLFDVAALAYGTGRSREQVQALCGTYLSAPVSASRFEAVHNAFWLREHAWAVDQLRRGRQRQEIVDQADASLAQLG